MTAERGLELRGRGHHEMKLGILIGELALQIEKIRARNMPGFERMSPGHGDIGNGAAFRLIFEIGGAIEQPEVGLIEDAGEFRSGDEPVARWHVSPPRMFDECYGAGSDEKAAGRRPLPFNPRIPVRYTLSDSAAGSPALNRNGRDKPLNKQEKTIAVGVRRLRRRWPLGECHQNLIFETP